MKCREKNKSTAVVAIQLLAFSLLGTGHLVARAAMVSTNNDKSTPPLTARVYGAAGLPQGLLDAAETQANQMLRDLPFHFKWVNCASQMEEAACSFDLAPTDLIVRVLKKALPQASTDALGVACPKGGGAVAYIFYDRMVALRTQRRSLPSIMGRVLAHEMVHLLLPGENHSDFGLMRGHWSTDDLGTGTSAWMGLSVATVKLIEKEALRRVVSAQNLGSK